MLGGSGADHSAESIYAINQSCREYQFKRNVRWERISFSGIFDKPWMTQISLSECAINNVYRFLDSCISVQRSCHWQIVVEIADITTQWDPELLIQWQLGNNLTL